MVFFEIHIILQNQWYSCTTVPIVRIRTNEMFEVERAIFATLIPILSHEYEVCVAEVYFEDHEVPLFFIGVSLLT